MTRDRGPGAMDALREEFVSRAVGRGVPEEKAREVFGYAEGFASYGFSAAHAAGFAELSYASAYMKRHFPAEFFCGLLNSQTMGFYSPRTLVNEARRMGISIHPPDVHDSKKGFSVEEEGGTLRVGLRYTKHITASALDSILEAREERSFSSVADLYQRTRTERDGLESMVRAGFLDGLSEGLSRGRTRLLAEARRLPAKRHRKEQPELPLPHPGSWWTARERTAEDYLTPAAEATERMEWEALGLNVRRHPLAPYRAALKDLGVVPSVRILELPHGSRVRTAGLLECLQRPPTRSGRPVYFLLIEDEAGLLQATIFERVYRKWGHVLHESGAYLLDGRVEQDRRRGWSFLVERILDLEEALTGAAERVPAPRAVPSSGSFVRAGRRGRRAG